MAVKILVSGYIGFSNFGDDAMLLSLVNHLKKQGCEITALSANPQLTTKGFNINAIEYSNPLSVISCLKKTDVLIQGGGNLIQNETSTLSLIYYASVIILAKLMFKKVILFSQGIGPVKGVFSNILSRLALGMADLIMVRDTHSLRTLSKQHISSHLTYDALWDFETPPYSPENAVGVQLRHYKNMREDFLKPLAKYIDMFFSDMEIRLFSFQNSMDATELYNFEKILKARNKLLKVRVIIYKNPSQIIEEFSKLKYLIGMRLHANILGLKYGVKILPLLYNKKVQDFAEEFNLETMQISKDAPLHTLFTTLTTTEQNSAKVRDARKNKFEWSYIDALIKKQRKNK